MAPVEIHASPSIIPTLTAGSHILLSASLTALIIRTIFRSYLALPPSSATRHRQHLRRGHVKLFSGLALLSLVTAGWFSLKGASISYRTWALERGVDLPESIFGTRGALRGGQHPGRLEIVRWLNDTPFYRDTLEIVAEKARYFWWGQQASLAMTSFGTYLAIEGRRRNISNLWAYLLLAQLVNLSFAQNLWFITVLLTPVPLPENVDVLTESRIPGGLHKSHVDRDRYWFEKIVPQRADTWLPKPGFYITALLATYSTVFLIPFASNTPSFVNIALWSKALPFAPMLLPYIIPESWGNNYEHPHEAHASYMKVFRTISTISSLLHLKTSGLALLYNTPKDHYYRHHLLHPIEKVHRSSTDRAVTAIERVLGAVGDHPAVGAVGYDVVISGLSLGIWAAIRGLDGKQILRFTIPWMDKGRQAAKEVKAEVENMVNSTDISTPLRRRGRPKKSETPQSSSTGSRRSKSKKLQADSDDTATYTPPSNVNEFNEGDEDEDEDWEMAALTWGVISSVGLGTGSAGVYGAEMTAR
ncbi:Alpha-mannosyltransferase alg11p protein [Rutstroemia sp. NJR-2017a WRK4]|nr:Alpha-mannosyltransferase alg11p protein [Rutstroemia sp. NJR-2017a WRK4]